MVRYALKTLPQINVITNSVGWSISQLIQRRCLLTTINYSFYFIRLLCCTLNSLQVSIKFLYLGLLTSSRRRTTSVFPHSAASWRAVPALVCLLISMPAWISSLLREDKISNLSDAITVIKLLRSETWDFMPRFSF